MSENDKLKVNSNASEENRGNVNTNGKSQDLVGDILHKERVTKRITIETIAKDLKLNEMYIKAIESNSHDELPAAPYIRVYLRSMANYLMLDADEILERYLKEQGIQADAQFEDNTEKVSIDVKEDSTKKSSTPMIIVILLIALAIIGTLTNRLGLLSNPEDTEPANTASDSTLNEEAYYDSIQAIPSLSDSSNDTTTSDSSSSDTVKVEEKKDMTLTISSKTDSVWIQIFSDNKSWRNFIRPGMTKAFTAKDSFNVHVGNNSALKYKLNGYPHRINGKGVRIFKITPEKTELWTSSKWKKVFKSRI